MTLRLAFMGTPDFAVPTLAELIAQGHDIAAVYSREARPARPGKSVQWTDLSDERRELGRAAAGHSP